MSFIKKIIDKTKTRVKGAATLIKELFKSPLSAVNPDGRDIMSAFFAMIMTTLIITILSFFVMFLYMKGDVSSSALTSVFHSQPAIYIPIFFSMMSISYILSFGLTVAGLQMKKGRFRLFKVVLFQLPRVHIVTTILYFLAAAINSMGSIYFFITSISIYLIMELLIALFEAFDETKKKIAILLVINVSLCFSFYYFAVPWLLRL